jgi:hypothetical protein
VTASEVVERFEDEFKNRNNLDVVDQHMTTDFVRHLPVPGLPAASEWMKAVGRLITGAIADNNVTVDLLMSDWSLGKRLPVHLSRHRPSASPGRSEMAEALRTSRCVRPRVDLAATAQRSRLGRAARSESAVEVIGSAPPEHVGGATRGCRI